jgi:gamma-glutamyltranspeptidase/glutathione hydrolase
VTARFPRAAADASDGRLLGAAREMLKTGHAIDAVAAGVWAACALSPSVILGPVQILVGGAGAGLHAVDGRVQHAGKGLARPRGFTPDEAIPDAARVGAPALPAALSTALASFGSVTLGRTLGPALEMARSASVARRRLLRLLTERGPLALTDRRIASELVLAAGRGRGGLLSQRDLEELRPAVVRAESTEIHGRRVSTVPWGAEAIRGRPEPGAPATTTRGTRIVVAVDRRGQFAIACYEVADAGLAIEALDLVAPLVADPVLRGRTRTPPGSACAAPAPIALREDDGALVLAAGVGESDAAEATLVAWLPKSLGLETSRDVPGLVALARAGATGVRAI